MASCTLHTHDPCCRLDVVGIAAYSHNFGALDGKLSTVKEILDMFSTSPRSSALNKGLLLLSQVFPILAELPTSRTRLMQKLNIAMEEISDALLARTLQELEMGVVGGKEEKSIIGLLSTCRFWVFGTRLSDFDKT